MVLNPHGIKPTFLKLNSWSPGAGFISSKNVLKKCEGKKKFYAYKNIFFKWVQSRLGFNSMPTVLKI